MKIDIDRLSEEELIELNHKVIERLRMLRDLRSHVAMMDFRIGERVMFFPEGRGKIVGTLTRFNRKSVTVITDLGQHWNVAPSLLKRADEQEEARTSTPAPFRLVQNQK